MQSNTGYARIAMKEGVKSSERVFSIIEVNRSFTDITGIPTDKLEGKDLLELISSDGQSGLDNIELYEKALLSNKVVSVERYSAITGRSYLLRTIPDNKNCFSILLEEIQSRTGSESDEVISLSRMLLDEGGYPLDYRNLTCEICKLAGADFGVFNLYSEDSKKFRNVAVYGKPGIVKAVYRLIGYSLLNREWDVSEARLNQIRHHHVVRFGCITDLAEGSIPEKLSTAISAVTNTGSVYVVEMSADSQIMGDFILFFGKGKEMRNNASVAVFANLVGVAIKRNDTETKRRKSETNLKNFFHSDIDFHWVLDTKGRIIEINETVINRLGYKASELLGQHISIVHPEALRQEAEKRVIEVVSGTESSCHIPLITKTGELIPVETYVIKGEWDGKNVFFGVSKDISLLKLSEEKFHRIFNVSPDLMGLCTVDTEQLVEVNNSFRETLGFTDQEVIGKTIDEIFKIEPDLKEEVRENIAREGSFRNREFSTVKKNGEQVVLLVSIDLVMPVGKVFYLIVGTDITRLKLAEKKLRESENNYRGLTERMYDILWTCDLNLQTTWVTPSVQKILGFTAEEILGKSPEQTIAPEYLVKAAALLVDQLALEGKEDQARTTTMKVGYYHKDGSVKILENMMTFIRDSEGKPIGIQGLSRDISERQKAEEELVRANDLLLETGMMAKVGAWEVDFVKGTVNWSVVTKKIMSVPLDFVPRIEDLLTYYKEGDSRDRIYECVENARLNGVSFDQEFIVIAFDGREHHVRNIAKPVFVNGTCQRLVGTFQDITDRKEYEIRIRESEQSYKNLQALFRNMADIIPDMVWAKDINGRYLFANNSVCSNLLGAVDTSEPIGKTDLFFTKRQIESHSDDPEWHTFGANCIDSDQETIRKGVTCQFDEYGNIKGKFLYLDVVKTPLEDDNGNIIGTVGTARDVTGKRSAEKKLLKSEANLKAIIENTLENIWSVNTSYEIEYVNEVFVRAFLATFGVELKVGLNILDALPENLRVIWKDRYDRAFRNEHFLFEDKLVLGDTIIYIEVAMNPIIVDGGVVGAALYGKDVTEKTIAQNQLRYQSKARKILVELSSGFINLPVADIRPAIQDSLARIGEFVGADRAYVFEYDFVGMTATNTIEWCRPGISAQIDKFQKASLDSFLSWVEHHKKGETVKNDNVKTIADSTLRALLEMQDVKSFLTIPFLKGGECIGFVGFDSVLEYHDYTDVESQLLQVYAQTLVNVLERIDNEKKLVIAKEKAEESDRLKTAFLTNMSHEIRTPMNGIIGFLELLKEPDLSEENKTEYIGIVTQSGNRLLNTLNDIIEISKIEAGELNTYISEVDTENLMRYYHSFFRQQAESKGIGLMLADHLEGQEAIMQTDRSKLESILSNLLKNAVKFTSTGYIEFGNRKAGDTLLFFVSDTGPGISSEYKDKIFERFIQGDITPNRLHEGSGLGLAIVKAYVEMLGGKIWVDSEDGKGSTFYFSLPYLGSQEIVTKKESSSPAQNMQAKGKTILVVEDDKASYMVLEKILTSENHKVLHITDGSEAVKFMKEVGGVDLILMDIKLPGMSGLEATKRIREFNTGIPILAQTAYAFGRDKEIALQAGCNDYISKPIRRADLVKMIRSY
ncbi:MAG: PAS domain S-box protein [Bacteroidales bacterium]